MIDFDGIVFTDGDWSCGDGLTLHMDDSEGIHLVLDSDNNLDGGSFGVLVRFDPNTVVGGETENSFDDVEIYSLWSDYDGFWLHPDGTILEFSHSGTWCSYDPDGIFTKKGYLENTSEGVKLCFYEEYTNTIPLCKEADGSLTLDGEKMVAVDSISAGISIELQPNAVLKGTWLYSDGDDSLVFDGVNSFTWSSYMGIINGSYIYDGDAEVRLIYDGYISEGDYMVFERDAGSYYTRADCSRIADSITKNVYPNRER